MYAFNNSQVYPGSQPIHYLPNNMEPYNRPEFLQKTFNFNQQLISAFNTLPHQMKLKLYLSLEEMRLLGYMNDPAAYQGILKEIIRRRAIIGRREPQLQQNKGQAEEWGTKLENLCEGHLKKMQKTNFLDDLPVAYTENHKIAPASFFDFLTDETVPTANTTQAGPHQQQPQEDDFEWVEPADESVRAPQPEVQAPQVHRQPGPAQESDQFEQYVSETQPPLMPKQVNQTQNPKIYEQPQSAELVIANSNNQRSQEGRTLLSPNRWNKSSAFGESTPTPKHIDVWDLEVIEDEPDKIHKIISSVMNKNAPAGSNHEEGGEKIQSIYEVQQSLPEVGNQKSSSLIDQQDQIVKPDSQGPGSSISSPTKIGSLDFDFFTGQSIQQQSNTANAVLLTAIPADERLNALYMPLSGAKELAQDQFQWQGSTEAESSPKEKQAFTFNAQFLVEQPRFSQNSIAFVQVPSNPNLHTNLDMGFFNSSTLQQNSPSSFTLDLGSLDFQVKQQATSNDFNKKDEDGEVQTSKMASSTILPSVDLTFLQPLRRAPPAANIEAALKKKYLDFNPKFYLQAANYIAALGFVDHPDFHYIKEQQHICNEIIRLSEAYTQAVEKQEEEDQIRKNIQMSKRLYDKLEHDRTAKVMKKYLGMQGLGLEFLTAKLTLEAGVPKQIIEHLMGSKNQMKFMEALTVLYLAVYFGSTFTISTFASQVIQFTEDVLARTDAFMAEAAQLSVQSKLVLKDNDNFKDLVANMAQLARIAERIIEVAGLCSREQLCPDLAAFQTKLKPYNRLQPQPLVGSEFVKYYSEFAYKPSPSIYELYSQISTVLEQHPLCAICLSSVGQAGAKKDDQKSYHFQCWNLKNEVLKFKNNQLSIKISY